MSTVVQVDMQHFRLKLDAIIFYSPYNTARDCIEKHNIRDEIFNLNDCVMIEPPQKNQLMCRTYKDTTSAVCNSILSITEEECLGWVLELCSL